MQRFIASRFAWSRSSAWLAASSAADTVVWLFNCAVWSAVSDWTKVACSLFCPVRMLTTLLTPAKKPLTIRIGVRATSSNSLGRVES